ncbi:hypothetical protein BGZ49_000644 [Haplosporangium sp. Z 27]|nr:hypothetical protein BGZ49_000644 [Haplosporangium sp. Z 27]
MRQSPVLHSKVVQAYLDPNASSSQRQLITPEYVRQAWLQDHQDNQLDSSEDDGSSDDEQNESLDQKVPTSVPIQVHGQPHILPDPSVPHLASSSSLGALSHQDQHHDEASWGFDDMTDVEETQQANQSETPKEFDDNIEIEQAIMSNQVESSLEYQDTADFKVFQKPEHPSNSHGFEDHIAIDNTVQLDAIEESWGFDDNIVIEEPVQTDQGDASWGFDNNVIVDTAEQHDQRILDNSVVADVAVPSDQMDTSWGFDEQLQTEDPIDEPQEHQQGSVPPQAEEYPHIHHVHEDDEDAWGYDDQLVDLVESAAQDIVSTPEPTTLSATAIDETTEDSINNTEFKEACINICGKPRNPFLSPEDDIPPEERKTEIQETQKVEPTDVTTRFADPSNLHYQEQEQHYSDISTPHLTASNDSDLSETRQTESTLGYPEVSVTGYSNEVHSEQETSGTHPSVIGVEDEDVETSWGFDEQVVNVETQPIENAVNELERDITKDIQHYGPEVVHESVTDPETSRHEPETLTGEGLVVPEPVSEGTANYKEQLDNGSDNEHDSEVREVFRASHSSSSITSCDVQITTSSVTLLPVIDNSSQSPRNPAPFSQTLNLQIKTETLPEFVEASALDSPLDQPALISVTEDIKGLGSDSEGSDIYGDLSTARNTLLGSSNRLNEILDDDDFLEHMERGVPMNRSISTPISDDEQPKFTMDDEVAELMERGESQPGDRTPNDTTESLDEGVETATPQEHDAGTSTVTARILDMTTDSESALQEDVPLTADIVDVKASVHDNTSTLQDSGAEKQEPDHISLPHLTADVVVATTTALELSGSDNPANVISDDQDPANPFSDAAAIDDQDAWSLNQIPPSNEDIIPERVEPLEVSAQLTDEAHEQTQSERAVTQDSNVHNAVEDDAWSDQNLDVDVEHSEQEHVKTTDIIHAEIEDNEVNVEEEEDAWAEQDTSIVGSSLITGIEKHEHNVFADVPNVQHQEQSEINLVPDAVNDDLEQPRDDISNDTTATIDDGLFSTHDLNKTDISTKHENTGFDDSLNAHVVEEQTQIHSSVVSDSTNAETEYSTSHDLGVADRPLEAAGPGPKADIELSSGIDEALTEDAWASQDDEIVFDSNLIPATEENAEISEIVEGIQESSCDVDSTQTLPEVSVDQTLDHAIDVALEDDAWADQDADTATIASVNPQIAEPVNIVDNIDSHVSDIVQDIPSGETNLDLHHHDFDATISDDAWDDQGISAESIGHEIEATYDSAPVVTEDESTVDPQTESKEVVAITEGIMEVETDNNDQTILKAIDDDAWGDQDNWSDHEVDILSSRGAIHSISSTIHVPEFDRDQQVHEAVEAQRHEQAVADIGVEDAINNALEEDMWDDQDININTISDIISHHDSTVSTKPVNEEPQQEHAAQETLTQAVDQHNTLASLVSDIPSHENEGTLGVEFNIDEALKADAWDAQEDDNAYLDQINANTVITTDADLEKAENLDESKSQHDSSLEVGGVVSSDVYVVESVHSQPQSHSIKATLDDAWGWDDDEVDIDLDIQKESIPSKSLETVETQAQHTHDQESEPSISNADSKDANQAETDAILADGQEVTTDSHGNSGTSERLSPLNTQEGHVSFVDISGEGDEDGSSQSPWQDLSPTSVSKKSEVGVGSEVESEFSVRSLDEYERVSPAPNHARSRSSGSGSGSVTSGSRIGSASTMSWTDLKHDEWQTDTSDITTSMPLDATSAMHASPHQGGFIATGVNAAETQDLPDISGADSWDFDDNDVDNNLGSNASLSQANKTPELGERRLFENQTKPSSALTPSPQYVKTQFSTPSVSTSSMASPTAVATEAPTEVEDDSHLPLAIRQQRARLAAKGKPLPPISKYKKTTGTVKETSVPQTPVVGATSPVVSFVSPVNPPISPIAPTSATPTSPDQKYISPALQRQRERLEKKKAAAVSPTATSQVPARRLTVTESISSSPLIPQISSPSTLKHTAITSPTLVKKNDFESHDQSSSPLLSSPTVEEFGQTTLRRGLSTSLGSSTLSTPVTPSSPLVEGSFIRRSKDGNRPKTSLMENQESDRVAKTSQSDTYRYTSRVSTSSSRSGWDDAGTDNDGGKDQAAETPVLGNTKRFNLQKESPKPPTSAGFQSNSSSSSFYQQTVPGLDDDNDGGQVETSKSSFATSTSGFAQDLPSASSSSYLSSKKVDDYDPYGPMASKPSNSKGKFRNSMEENDIRSDSHEEILIGQSSMSPSVSLLSPTSATNISNRHDHSHRQHNNIVNTTINSGSGNNTNATSGSSGGGSFFGSSGGSLIGDISSILNEKKTLPPGGSGNSSGVKSYDNDDKKANIVSSASSSSASNSQKPSGWSFGSWVSSAVAVASDAVDKAYETLDPEYSKMKKSGSSTLSSDGLDDTGSLSPYKKPGYVVGGSSLALGLASISAPSQQQQQQQEQSQPQLQHQRQQQQQRQSPSMSPLGFGSSDRNTQSYDDGNQQGISPRLTRKNVTGR